MEPLEETHQSASDYVSYQSIDDSQRVSLAGSGSECLVSPSIPTNVIPQKRRYKRHPKPDENAPPRPASAYVLFANQVREQEKDSDLNFAQLARLVGDRWKNLVPAEKEAIEAKAAEAKRQYNGAVTSYKKSHEYAQYQDYLVEFKERALKDEKPEKLEPPKKAQRLNERDSSDLGLPSYSGPRPIESMGSGPPANHRSLFPISAILRDPRDIPGPPDRLPPPFGYAQDHLPPVNHAPESYSRHSHLPYPLPFKPLNITMAESMIFKDSPDHLPRLRDDRGAHLSQGDPRRA